MRNIETKDKIKVVTPEKIDYLDLMDIENTNSNSDEDAHSMMMMIKAKLMNDRIWHPVQICCLNDVPSNLLHWFCIQNNKVIVKWFGENNFSSVNSSQNDVLGENLVDAARSTFIMKQYNIALG